MPKGIPNNPSTDKRFKDKGITSITDDSRLSTHTHSWIYISEATQYTESAEDGSSIPLETPKTKLRFVCNCGAMKQVEGFNE